MGTIDIEGLVNRLGAIEIEALAALTPAVTADAVPRFFHAQEAFPYFTHRVGNITVSSNSESFDVYTVPVIARLVVGHIDAGYKGQNETKLYQYIPQVLDTLNSREYLQSETYTAAMPHLRSARVATISGFSAFRNTGINAVQVGTEFTVEAELINQIEQRYL